MADISVLEECEAENKQDLDEDETWFSTLKRISQMRILPIILPKKDTIKSTLTFQEGTTLPLRKPETLIKIFK